MNQLRALLLPMVTFAALPLVGCYGSMYAGPGYVRPAYVQQSYVRPGYVQPAYQGGYYTRPHTYGRGAVIVQTQPVYVQQPGVTVVQTQGQAQGYQQHWVEGRYVADANGNTMWIDAHWE
jgi:hypothetical protein